MSVSILDFSKLRTPPRHGDTLIAPDPATWAASVRANDAMLRGAETLLLGKSLAAWRRSTREAIAGGDDRPVIVTGHQPGFFHPGVWAKHIVATRLARALKGVAIDLVVDNDAAKETTIAVPTLGKDGLSVTPVPFAGALAGHTYEQIPARTAEALKRSEQAMRTAMGARFATSQMPIFLEAAAFATKARDWVEQIIAGRRSIEVRFGVELQTLRVSKLWCTPLVVDVLLRAPRFAASYNRALANYRRINRVRSARRPIPDLLHAGDRCEVPLWAHRANQSRRRVFVAHSGNELRLYAGETEMGRMRVAGLTCCEGLDAELQRCDGWVLRPRALTLTMWARLLLADLFIHGIGGAKYDRISDDIIGDYYHISPPQMVCVSATWHLDLPMTARSEESIRRLRHTIRDMTWNPQRHLPPNADVAFLVAQRDQAVRESVNLQRSDARNRSARRTVFERIREINKGLLDRSAAVQTRRRAELMAALDELRQDRISRRRDYFFGLYDRRRLEQLVAALPDERSFGV